MKRISFKFRNKTLAFQGESLFLFLVLMSFFVSIKIPIGSKSLVMYLAELITFFILGIDFIFRQKKIKKTIGYNKYFLSAKHLCVIMLFYIIITRLLFLVDGFDVDWFTYPRISIYFFACYFWIFYAKNSDKSKVIALYLFISVVSLLEIFYMIENGDLRSSTILTNVNVMVGLLLICIPTLFYLFLNSNKQLVKYWSLILVLLSVGLILASGSRGGFLISLIVLFAELIFSKKMGRKLGFFLIVIISIMFIYPYIKSSGITDSIERAISSLFSTFSDSSGNAAVSDTVRLKIWSMAWDSIRENLLFGSGNLLMYFYMDIYFVHQSAHNFLLELLMSYGVVGSIIYLFIIIKFIQSFMIKKMKNEKRVVYLTLFAFLSFALVEPTFTEKLLLCVFLLIISINHDSLKIYS